MADRPFESIESAHEFIGLLMDEVTRGREDLSEDMAAATREDASRRMDALRLADYKLKQLTEHLAASHRILNDLRTIRRLLIGERKSEPPTVDRRPGAIRLP